MEMSIPIYIEPNAYDDTGSRRISREKKGLVAMLSQDIADATHRLQAQHIHEANKMHSEKTGTNPGRLEGQWTRNGK